MIPPAIAIAIAICSECTLYSLTVQETKVASLSNYFDPIVVFFLIGYSIQLLLQKYIFLLLSV